MTEKLVYTLFTGLSKKLAILLDPDKFEINDETVSLANLINSSDVDFILVGGSLLTSSDFDKKIEFLKFHTEKPVIIFPGNSIQVSKHADGILFLSLISGRNPEFLIGQQVVAAPSLKSVNIAVLPTGYLLIDGGKPTTASYISNTNPIPANKPEIAATTALAGQYLGLKLIYLDAGSGAEVPVSAEMIKQVRAQIDVPLIVGGGIKTIEQINNAWESGADCVVVGTAIEQSSDFLKKLSSAKTGLA